MLVVEVIKLNRVPDLLMTRDATSCILRRPTDLWIGTNILKVERQPEYDNLKHWTA
jgi:hypothetical protein